MGAWLPSRGGSPRRPSERQAPRRRRERTRRLTAHGRACGLFQAHLAIALDDLQRHLRLLGKYRKLAGEQTRAAQVVLYLLGETLLIAAHSVCGCAVTRLGLTSCTGTGDLFDHLPALEGIERCVDVRDTAQVQHPLVCELESMGQLIAIARALYHQAKQRPMHRGLHRRGWALRGLTCVSSDFHTCIP